MPSLTVDTIIVHKGKIVVIKRKYPPFEGDYALPGGFVEDGERVEEAAIREAEEETGLRVRLVELNGVYSDPKRDPRRHTVSICYIAESIGGELKEGSDAIDVETFKINDLPKLAFDHDEMINNASEVLNGILS
ncbi:MAG: NUDIX hydrolase [Halobacteriota archaeon]|nr:NUDIX hydrolase [Halobacteriota archaeon]MDY6960132.1 NUDIX hydrolase [Halobacteriota archaeon]